MIRVVLALVFLIFPAEGQATRTAEVTEEQYVNVRAIACTTIENANNVLVMARNTSTMYAISHFVPVLTVPGFCTGAILVVPLSGYLKCKRRGCSVSIPKVDEFRYGVIFPE